MFGLPSDRTLTQRKGQNESPPLAVIGGEIGKARKKRRMSTLEVSQITRIPERYVRCIEAGDFASLPGKPFVFGFTRAICNLLELDADACIAVIKAEMYESGSVGPGILPQSYRSGAPLWRRRSGPRAH